MHAAVGRNGHHLVRITKVRAKDGTPETFRSALPWLHLIGMSSGEMAPALKVLPGPDAKQGSVGKYGVPA